MGVRVRRFALAPDMATMREDPGQPGTALVLADVRDLPRTAGPAVAQAGAAAQLARGRRGGRLGEAGPGCPTTESVAAAGDHRRPRNDVISLGGSATASTCAGLESWLGTPAGRAVREQRSEVIEFDASPVVAARERVVRGADWLERRWQEGGPKLKQLAIASRARGQTLPSS